MPNFNDLVELEKLVREHPEYWVYKFKCQYCGHIDVVDPVMILPDGAGVYGSTFDFCGECDEQREFIDDEPVGRIND